LAQALRSGETLPHPCLCNLLAVAILRASVSDNWYPHLDRLRRQDLLGWVPGPTKEEICAECENLALKELANEICFCLSRKGHFKVKVVP